MYVRGDLGPRADSGRGPAQGDRREGRSGRCWRLAAAARALRGGGVSVEYPIATSCLQKGDVIAAAAIESAFGVVRGTQAYRLKQLQIRKYVEWKFAERGLD